MKHNVLGSAFVHATGTAAYVVLIASFLNAMPRIFGNTPMEPTIFIPIMMLLLFIISASVTGFLVLGKPILWYLDGHKKEAVTLFFSTLGFLALGALVAFLILWRTYGA